MSMESEKVHEALELLGYLLEQKQDSPSYSLVVCGGAALISQKLTTRLVTKDIDVVALLSGNDNLISPDPLPSELLEVADQVSENLTLPHDWLNNGPSQGTGGLFQMGLPDGFKERLSKKAFGSKLSVHFVGKLDQICFKLFAAVDQGFGRHTEDLKCLKPTIDELKFALAWLATMDDSEGFQFNLKNLLEALGYDDVI